MLTDLFCHCLYTLTLATLSQSLVFVAVSFAYRLYVLDRYASFLAPLALAKSDLAAGSHLALSPLDLQPLEIANEQKLRALSASSPMKERAKILFYLHLPSCEEIMPTRISISPR